MEARRTQLLLYVKQIEAQITALFGKTYADALRIPEVRKALENGEPFTWKGNPAAQRKLEEQLQLLAKVTNKTIRNGITGAWKEGESETKDNILERFGKGKNSKEVNTILENSVKQQRAKGMNAHAFAARKEGGLTLSNRVWNLAGSAKKDLEIIIQNGIIEGKSADDLSRELKDYLNEPDRLYRRVKNKETGQLELSQAAKKYNPGGGVYRSAYKNALRLAITEINAAYRRAEWESYQNNPLIVGYRIELSNNHTIVVNGKVRRLYDICDVMAGKEYPKTFLWTGWHPHCRCRMVPIMISDEDFKARQKARQAGKLDEWKPSKSITEPPKEFTDWLNKNKDRLYNSKHLPPFIKDNLESGILVPKDKPKPSAGIEESKENLELLKYNDLIDNAKNLTEVRKGFESKIREILGNDFTVRFTAKDTPLEVAKIYAKELVNLSSTYRLETEFVKFYTQRAKTTYEKVIAEGAYKDGQIVYKKSMNVSKDYDKNRLNDVPTNKSLCDKDRVQYSTINHEFAHNLYMTGVNKSPTALKFKQELTNIRSDYYKELNGLERNSKEYNNIYLGRYASSNIDEFLAEAFQEYRNRRNPSKYANMVGELVDKYFKR